MHWDVLYVNLNTSAINPRRFANANLNASDSSCSTRRRFKFAALPRQSAGATFSCWGPLAPPRRFSSPTVTAPGHRCRRRRAGRRPCCRRAATGRAPRRPRRGPGPLTEAARLSWGAQLHVLETPAGLRSADGPAVPACQCGSGPQAVAFLPESTGH